MRAERDRVLIYSAAMAREQGWKEAVGLAEASSAPV
jgi:hypothetical protein